MPGWYNGLPVTAVQTVCSTNEATDVALLGDDERISITG